MRVPTKTRILLLPLCLASTLLYAETEAEDEIEIPRSDMLREDLINASYQEYLQEHSKPYTLHSSIRMVDTLLLEDVAHPGLAGLPEENISQGTKILIFGDSGTGLTNQYLVSRTMAATCANVGCDWTLMAGDNIYENGATSSDDRQFFDKFEKPFAPINLPFYVALGNHDVRPGVQGAQAQVAYSQKNPKWHMPAPYYSFVKGDTETFVIDSNTFARNQAQQDWLRTSMHNSQAHWKLVMGHHSPDSVGTHRLSDPFEGSKLRHLNEAISDTLCQYADAYIGGHDHHLQINERSCGLVVLLSGAAAKTRRIHASLVRKHRDEIRYAQGDQLGFMHLTLAHEMMTVRAYDQDGHEIYRMGFPKK